MKKMLLSSLAVLMACCIAEIASAQNKPATTPGGGGEGRQIGWGIKGYIVKEETNSSGGKTIWCAKYEDSWCYIIYTGRPVDPNTAPNELTIDHVVFGVPSLDRDFPKETRVVILTKNINTGEVTKKEDVIHHQ